MGQNHEYHFPMFQGGHKCEYIWLLESALYKHESMN